jgi:hypothetical protein
VSANTAGSQKAAAAKVEPSRNLRRFMSLPDKSTTVRTVRPVSLNSQAVVLILGRGGVIGKSALGDADPTV